MCGRMSLYTDWKEIKDEFDVDHILAEFTPRANIAPSQEVGVIVAGSITYDNYKWGLMPKWAKDNKYAMINARSETISEKAWFKEAFTNFRCLVPVSSFFEWDKEKNPHLIKLKEKKIFALAGICNIWKPNKNSKAISTFCLITCEANKFMSDIHHRMPVIINKEDYAEWLNPNNKDLDSLNEMLKPTREKMVEWVVSRDVNKPQNIKKEILNPVEKQSKL